VDNFSKIFCLSFAMSTVAASTAALVKASWETSANSVAWKQLVAFTKAVEIIRA
jgi:hypothetical protein